MAKPQRTANVRTSVHGRSHSFHHMLSGSLGYGLYLYVAPLGCGTTAENAQVATTEADKRKQPEVRVRHTSPMDILISVGRACLARRTSPTSSSLPPATTVAQSIRIRHEMDQYT